MHSPPATDVTGSFAFVSQRSFLLGPTRLAFREEPEGQEPEASAYRLTNAEEPRLANPEGTRRLINPLT